MNINNQLVRIHQAVRSIKTSGLMCMVLLLALQLSGCSREPIPPKLVYESENYVDYQVHYEPGLTEQWNDPDILSTPRIQFTWAPPGTHRLRDATIWSMRLDGTDLRQVVPKEVFNTPTSGGTKDEHYYSRSPNNRYLAYTMGSKYGYERRLIDLETQTVKVLGVGIGATEPQFRWFKGGRYLTFFGKTLTQYDIETGEQTEINTKFAFEGIAFNHYAVDNGNNIVFNSANHIEKFDFDTGELIEKFEGYGRHLTLDEQYWLQHKDGPIYLSPYREPAKKLFSLDKKISTTLLSGLTGNGPYISRGGGAISLIDRNQEKRAYYSFPENDILGNISFTNYHNFVNQSSHQE